jgi:hypothetical protein
MWENEKDETQDILGGLVVIVLAMGLKVRGFKPGRGRLIFKGDKNPQHDFFGGEVKPSASCRTAC